jgi:hypothetical protein
MHEILSAKKPFITKDSRPNIQPDTRLSDLTVGELTEILKKGWSPEKTYEKTLMGEGLSDKKKLELEKRLVLENIDRKRIVEGDPKSIVEGVDWGRDILILPAINEVLEKLAAEIVSLKEQLKRQ